MADPSTCPTIECLQQFLLGRLPDVDAEAVQLHLATCPTCVTVLGKLEANDTLVEMMRAQGVKGARSEDGIVAGLVHDLRDRAAPANPTETTSEGRADTARLKPMEFEFLAPPETPDELGRLGGYRVLRILGAGGMGIVLEVEDVKLKRHLALKVMKPALAVSATARRRFLREAQSVAALDHDHIVAIHKVGEDRGVPFLAMPLLRGESLEERLQRQEAGGNREELSIAETLRIGREIAEGLAAAHAAGVTHRDIKPANIWLESGGEASTPRVKILDFGLARPDRDDAHLTQAGFVAGTPAYMSPEQAEGDHVDARSDLFSLGAVLYRMTTGRLPFRGSNAVAVLRALAVVDPDPPRRLNPRVPAALSSLILRLLAKKPADRPSSARGVVEAIVSIERDLTATPVAKLSPMRKRVILVSILAGVVLVSVAAALLVLRRDDLEPDAVDATHPFVVLGRDGEPSSGPARFASLAEAIAASKSGDVIEIRGNGPFVSPPIKIVAKPLTVRAGAGSRPVVRLSPEGVQAQAPLLQSNARLTLEGLELQRADPAETATKGLNPLVLIWKAPLFVAHCRLLMTGPSPVTALASQRSPIVEVRHCQFGGGPRSRGVRWASPEEGRLVVENCLFAAVETAVAHAYNGPNVRRVSLRFAGNTVAGGTPLWSNIAGTRGELLAINARDRKPPSEMPVHLDMFDNILDADSCAAGSVNLTNQEKITPSEYKMLMHCLILMREERNLLRAGMKFLDMQLNDKEPIHLADNLAEWQKWQPRPQSGSREEKIRYQTTDAEAKARANPESAQPGDFRPHLEVPGIEAVKDGFNRGIQPDQVGPAAYDLWRRTPEYTAWAKASSEVSASSVSGPGPYVVIGDEANTYAALEDAVDAAADGDTIEIRGNGPFSTPPLISFKKSMTIRAGAGFTPVLDFEPTESRSSLLYSNGGALTLEGLTLRHVNKKPGNHLMSCQRAPCRILNCRFERGSAFIEYSSQCEVRNCMFVTPSPGAFVILKRWSGDMVVENNVAVAEPAWARGVVMEITEANLPVGTILAGAKTGSPRPETMVRIRRNTFVLHPIDLILCAPLQPTSVTKPIIRLDVSENVFDCDNSAMTFTQNQGTYTKGATEYAGAEAESLLQRMVNWQGRQNLYPKGIDLLFFYGRGKPIAIQPECRDLASWERIWGTKETAPIFDRPRFQGGDIRGRPLVAPSSLTPEDLKLAPGSPGAGVGEGGSDLGADTRFVGPGAAYERFRATPEYAAWRQRHKLRP